ncbi:MAG TPA: hypothetical protein VGE09_11190 [Pseudoxanthomonas sp.]
MPSGFKTSGTDLDDIFLPYSSGTKPANTGFSVAGVDLKDRYQPGSGAPVTGFKIAGGPDINTIFASLLINPPQFNGQFYDEVTTIGAANGYITFGIRADGTWFAAPGGAGPSWSGNWHGSPAAGVGDGFEVKFVPGTPARGTSIITNGASDFASLASDRTIVLTVSADGEDAADDSISVQVLIRRTGGAVSSDGTCFIGVSLP